MHRFLGLGIRRGGIPAFVLWVAFGATAQAEINWVTYDDQTSFRLVSDPSVGALDGEEKDYAWGDVDQDGDTDLVCVRKEPFTTPGGRRNVLFMNEGTAEGQPINGVLVDRTMEYAPSLLDLTNDRDVLLADVDGDGWLDMVTAPTLGDGVAKEISHPRIYINLGEDENGDWSGFVFEEPNLRIPTFSVAPRFTGVAAGDVDDDDDLDIYFVDHDQGEPLRLPGDDLNDRLLINDGTGFFTDESELRLTPEMLESTFGLNAQIADMNGDGLAEIIKDTALTAPTEIRILYNNPTGTGQDGYFEVRENFVFAPYHVSIGDLNNDSRPDMVVSDDGDDRYFLNVGNGPDELADFVSYTFDFLDNYANDDTVAGENVVADLDRDGFLDAVITDVDAHVAGCNRRMHFYRNLGNTPNVTMQDQGTLGIGIDALKGTHDVAVLDINGDEWLDLVVGRCESTEIYINQPPLGLVFTYPQGLPGFVVPGEDHVFQVAVGSYGEAQPAPGTGEFHYSVDEGPFSVVVMDVIADNLYEAVLPASVCLTRFRYFFTAETVEAVVFSDPGDAPANTYVSQSATGSEITYRDEMEGDVSDWSVVDENLTAGSWEQADPNGTIFLGGFAAPEDDATFGEGTMAFVTDNGPVGGSPTANDLDGGPTRLTSPVIDLSGGDASISYSRWMYCDDFGNPQEDTLTVDVSNDDGASWVPVPEQSTKDTARNWENSSFLVSDYVPPTATVRVRFSVKDDPAGGVSVTEAGIDNFQVEKILCDSPTMPCDGDTNGDLTVDPLDYGFVLARLGCAVGTGDPACDAADANLDGTVDPLDAGYVQARFGSCDEGS